MITNHKAQSGITAPGPSGDTSGVTDTAIIQNLIDTNALGSGVTANTIWLRNGIYWTTGLYMAPGVNLVGLGWGATRIKAAANSTNAVVGTRGAFGDHSGPLLWNAAARVAYMTLDGNQQNGATGRGLQYSAATPLVNYQPFGDHDPMPVFEHLQIVWCGNDGACLGDPTNKGAWCQAMMHHCFVFGNWGYGIRVPGFDCMVDSCNVGVSKFHGIFEGNSTTQYTHVKSWYSGTYYDAGGSWHTPGNFDGFYFAGTTGYKENPSTLVGCLSQDNYGFGYTFSNYIDTVAQGCLGGGNQLGLLNIVGATSNLSLDIQHTSSDLSNPSTGYLVTFDNTGGGMGYNRIRIPFNTVGAFGYATPIQYINGANASFQDLEIGFERCVQYPSYAATMYPQPWLGKTIMIPVNGALTVGGTNSPTATGWCPSGMRMTLIFTQDGTGHAVTWDSSYSGPPTPPTVSTAAGSVTAVEFVNTSVNALPTWRYVKSP